MDRLPGRYNLHRLGWKNFEDLVIEINRIILNSAVTSFRMGADGGRDGYFKGEMAGDYKSVAKDACSVVIQCKHTSSVGEGLKLSDVIGEIQKITKLAETGEADLYVIFSNKRLRSEDEKIIRTEFEKIKGVKRCLIFAEEWIESHIDGNYKLLRRVPRLFGIGDLSQILSHNVSNQTRLIIEEMKTEQAVFVPTPSYREAVSALEQNGLVVLIGPPASGKSAIAVNLCMVLGAEDEELEVIKIETAEQFISSWSAQDRKKLFWIDDFLGETTLDGNRTKPWSAVFDKIRVAKKSGNKFIFTCRDYILKDAHTIIRKHKMDFFEDHAVFIRVDDFDALVRERILYNHVKMGTIDVDVKRALKEFLFILANLPEFTPEIARRIGDKRFHRNLKYDRSSLINFVRNPVHFFAEVIHDLGVAEQAVIAYLLLSNNSLPDPVKIVPTIIHDVYGVDISDVRRALINLQGSLTKLSIIGKNRVWQVHHPSMIDAMHSTLKDHGAMLDLFVLAAPVEILLRDCSTFEMPHKLFVPISMYNIFVDRLFAAETVQVASFLCDQCDDFLQLVIKTYPHELTQLIGKGFDEYGNHFGLRLLNRYLDELNIVFEPGIRAVEETLEVALWKHACAECIYSEDFDNPIDIKTLRSCLRQYRSKYQDTIDLLLERSFYDLQYSSDDVNDVLSYLSNFFEALDSAANNLFSSAEYNKFERYTYPIYHNAEDELTEKMRLLSIELDSESKEWSVYMKEFDFYSNLNIFSDVDE